MLQSLLPRSLSSGALPHPRAGGLGSVAAEFGLHGLQSEPYLAASLAATLGASDMEGLDDLASFDIPSELERDLFQPDSTIPNVRPTPSTESALGIMSHDPCGQPNGDGSSGGGGGGEASAVFDDRLSGLPPPHRKQRLEGIPMARSGCSGLLDSMTLDMVGEGGGTESDDASMETIALSVSEQESANAIPAAPSSRAHGTTTHERQSIPGATEQWRAEPSDMSCEADRYVQVITAGEEPFHIVWASEAWLQLCEFAMGQVLGHTFELIQGPLTTRTSLAQLMGAIRGGDPVSLSMVNHTRTGKAFSHTLRVEPLRDSSGKVQCFQATSSNIEFLAPSMHASMSALAPTAPTEPLDSTSASLQHQSSEGDLPGLPPPASPLLPSSPASPSLKSMKRVGSDLKISEMLDLFDASNRAAASSPALVPTMEAPIGEAEWQ